MIPIRFLLWSAVLLPGCALAADAGPGLAASVAQMLLGLAVVIGLLLGALFVLKRLSNPAGTLHGTLRTRGAVAVGPRERVVLLEVGGKVLVLGVAPGQVSTLLTLEASDLPAATPAASALDTSSRDFQSWLKQMMEKRK